MNRVVFVQGYPGSGKSALSRGAVNDKIRLSDGKGLVHVSAGARVRAILAGQCESVYRESIKEERLAIESLRPPSPKLVFDVVNEAIQNAQGTVIIDGFPREMDLVHLLTHADGRTLKVLGNLVIDVPSNVAMHRQLERISVDGHPLTDITVARRRIDEYDHGTSSVVEAVTERWGGIRIDGDRPFSLVQRKFNTALLSLDALTPAITLAV
jgi:adenylate kinase family enzyme